MRVQVLKDDLSTHEYKLTHHLWYATRITEKLFNVFDVLLIVWILGWTEQKEQSSGSGEAILLNHYTVPDQEKRKEQQKTQQSQMQQSQAQVYIDIMET